MLSIETVQRWQETANRQDVAALLELSDPQVEIVGPRGIAHGHAVLADWVRRAGVQFTTLRAFARDTRVVVTQHGIWRSIETGAIVGEATVATAFQVSAQRITRIARHDSLEQALAEAQLELADEQPLKKSADHDQSAD
jgi:hypothetical protein